MDWRNLLLSKLGAPQSNTNLYALNLWAASEGTPSYIKNWLATTLVCCGGSQYISSGVQQYPTVADGVEATYLTLVGGGYSKVVAEFQVGTSLYGIWDAINSSPWCSGCQKGHYPIAWYNALGSNPPPGGGGGGGGGGGPPPKHPPLPPGPGADDYSAKLRHTAGQFYGLSQTLKKFAD